MKSIEINQENIKGSISRKGITLLDFWAPWCAPCKVFGPVIDKLAYNNSDVLVGKVNVDDNGVTAASYGIRTIPTVIIFKDGEKVNQISGAVPLVRLQEAINSIK